MRITITSGPARRAPRIGDRRVTKKHGLQLRVVETHHGMWVRSGSRYCYAWLALGELIGTEWEYLLRGLLPSLPPAVRLLQGAAATVPACNRGSTPSSTP